VIARAATNDDVDEVVRLAAVMYATMHHDVTNPLWLAGAHDAFVDRLGADLAVFVVDAPSGNGLIASGAGTISTRLPAPNNLSARVGYIQWIATEVEARGQGCGRAVMNALLQWFDEQEVPVVELHATPDGEPLYRDLGFSDQGPVALRRRSSPA
jgi:GNAT superfamily N-acetyltransferase